MKTGAIIQARVGSTRLPRKVLLTVLGKTILEFVIERVRKAGAVDKIVVATTIAEEDREIADIARRLGAIPFAGSEEDVLERFYEAAKKYNLKHIVRITADCPLIDPRLIDKVVNYYFDTEADYCSNTIHRTFPDGQDVEVFSFRALEKAHNKAAIISEREHVTPYITKHKDEFKISEFRNKEADLSAKKWSLDRPEDYEFIKAVLESLYPADPDFDIKTVCEFLKSHPDVDSVNKDVVIQEGYMKSLKEDKVARG